MTDAVSEEVKIEEQPVNPVQNEVKEEAPIEVKAIEKPTPAVVKIQKIMHAPNEESEFQFNQKLKSRKDLINAVKALSAKTGIKPPKGYHQRTKEELKGIVAGLVDGGVNGAAKDGEAPSDLREDMVVQGLYNCNIAFMRVGEMLVNKNAASTGFQLQGWADVFKAKERATELKGCLRALYKENKEMMDAYISPTSAWAMVMTSSAMESAVAYVPPKVNVVADELPELFCDSPRQPRQREVSSPQISVASAGRTLRRL